MIEIRKSEDDQFYAVHLGDNGEPLATSETVVKKQSIWKNILAQAKGFGKHSCFTVRDVTGKRIQLWLVKSKKAEWVRTLLPAKTKITKL
jgi:hypothetical protein